MIEPNYFRPSLHIKIKDSEGYPLLPMILPVSFYALPMVVAMVDSGPS